MVPSLTIESDYRFRGVSLSRDKPSLRVGLAHDDASGWYAGLSAAMIEIERGSREVQLIGYAGIARRASYRAAAHWELGATATRFGGRGDYDYVELIAGWIEPRWSARLHWSPDYFGAGRQSLYAEWNGGWAIDEPRLPRPLRLFAHAGALRVGGERTRLDARAGASVAFDGFDVQLAWVGVQRSGAFVARGARHNTVVLSASFFF